MIWSRGSQVADAFVRPLRILAVAGLLAGCAGNPINNLPLTARPTPGYDFGAWIDARDRLNENLILLSFSGGGVRAAALAASVSQQLHALGLARHVAIVSSTSGGSVTAGFLAAKGAERLDELSDRFLLHDNQSALTPAVVGGLLTGANRSQHFAAYLDERVFAGGPRTYGELMRTWSRSPFVILNASDMSSSHTFEFTQASFDTLCSDLSSFRLSEAVAASAAFPFLMSPITLRNNWDVPACKDGPAPFSPKDFKEAEDRRFFDLEYFVRWRYRHALRYSYDKNATPPPYRRIEYVHLLDGGLSDNLAARALLRAFAGNVHQLLAKGVRRLLLVQVNAKSDSPQEIDHSPATPSQIDVFKTVALNPIDVTTALSSYVSREFMVATVNSVNQRVTTGDQLYFYPVQIDFDQLETASAQQVRAKALPTRWSLPEDDIKFLGGIGRGLLERHPCFQAFARDAKVSGVATAQARTCDEFINVRIAERKSTPAGPFPPPPAVPVSEKVTFAADAFFDSGKADLKPEARAKLDELVSKVQGIDLEVIVAVGHSDSVGDDAYNQILSARRAEAVKDYLTSKGIEKNRVYTEGKGEKQPVADNKTAESRAKNRRVEIEVVGTRVRR